MPPEAGVAATENGTARDAGDKGAAGAGGAPIGGGLTAAAHSKDRATALLWFIMAVGVVVHRCWGSSEAKGAIAGVLIAAGVDYLAQGFTGRHASGTVTAVLDALQRHSQLILSMIAFLYYLKGADAALPMPEAPGGWYVNATAAGAEDAGAVGAPGGAMAAGATVLTALLALMVVRNGANGSKSFGQGHPPGGSASPRPLRADVVKVSVDVKVDGVPAGVKGDAIVAFPVGAAAKCSEGVVGATETVGGKAKHPTEFPSALGYTAASGYSPSVIKARAEYEERNGHVLHLPKAFKRSEGVRLNVVRKCIEEGRPVPSSFAMPVGKTLWYATNRMRIKMREAAYPSSNPVKTKRCFKGAAF